MFCLHSHCFIGTRDRERAGKKNAVNYFRANQLWYHIQGICQKHKELIKHRQLCKNTIKRYTHITHNHRNVVSIKLRYFVFVSKTAKMCSKFHARALLCSIVFSLSLVFFSCSVLSSRICFEIESVAFCFQRNMWAPVLRVLFYVLLSALRDRFITLTVQWMHEDCECVLFLHCTTQCIFVFCAPLRLRLCVCIVRMQKRRTRTRAMPIAIAKAKQQHTTQYKKNTHAWCHFTPFYVRAHSVLWIVSLF